MFYFTVIYASGEKQRFESDNITELLNKQREFVILAKEMSKNKNKNKKKANQTNLEIVQVDGVLAI